MIRHAADPDIPHTMGKIKGEDYLKGILQIIVKIIEKNIPEPCAEDEPNNGPHEKILDDFNRIIIFLMLYPVCNKDVRQREGNKVHETVIADLKGTNLKDYRTDVFRKMLPVHTIPLSNPQHRVGRKMLLSPRLRMR